MRDRLTDIEVEERGTAVIARLSGEVDNSNAVELKRALEQRVPPAAVGLIVDLSQVGYLDSAGIELIFQLARSLRDRRQHLRLIVPASSPVRRVLVLCDVGGIAPLDEAIEEAVDGLELAGV
jgi:anti-sigma B factor antagonist